MTRLSSLSVFVLLRVNRLFFYRFHAGVDGIFSHVRAVWGGLGHALHLFVFFCVGVLPLYAWWRAVVEAGIHVLQE